jgi:hypothetical protein
MPLLATVGGNFQLGGMNLSSMNASLLSAIAGTFRMDGTAASNLDLPSLTSIGGTLTFAQVTGSIALSALPSARDIVIENSTQASTAAIGISFPLLTSAASLTVRRSQLTTLAGFNALVSLSGNALSTGALTIDGKPRRLAWLRLPAWEPRSTSASTRFCLSAKSWRSTPRSRSTRSPRTPNARLEQLIAEACVIHESDYGRAASRRARVLSELESDRPWYRRTRDAWLRRVAREGLSDGE